MYMYTHMFYTPPPLPRWYHSTLVTIKIWKWLVSQTYKAYTSVGLFIFWTEYRWLQILESFLAITLDRIIEFLVQKENTDDWGRVREVGTGY